MVKYSIEALLHILKSLPAASSYLVAYSGGLDSHVLLYSIASLKRKHGATVRAVHVNHGISINAEYWAGHCRSVCKNLGLDLTVHGIAAGCPPGESLESWARQQRYAVLAEMLEPRELLLTAHHKDDQAETLLLQLFRGCGPEGLSAMPVSRTFGNGWHCRPLLVFSRSELLKFSQEHGLEWIEDESNLDTGIDRNYVRQQLIPQVKLHWPGIVETLSRAARHQADAASLQDDLAELDLAAISGAEAAYVLNIIGLKELSPVRQKNLLRHWLRKLDFPVPDTRQLQHIITDVICSRHDAMPCVSWGGVELRRYRQYLYATRDIFEHDADQVIIWELDKQITVAHGKLTARLGRGNGIKAYLCKDNRVEVHYRRGGETIRPAGHHYHHELKKLLQEHAVPPWLRDRIPLLYIDGKFAAVPGKWIDEEFIGSESDSCWQISWEGIEQIFQD